MASVIQRRLKRLACGSLLLLSACIETHPARVVTPYGNYGYPCPPEYELYGLCRPVHRPHNKHNPHNR